MSLGDRPSVVTEVGRVESGRRIERGPDSCQPKHQGDRQQRPRAGRQPPDQHGGATAVVERPPALSTCSAGPVTCAFSHGSTMTVLMGLPFGTVSWSCASWGAATCDELALLPVPTDGSFAPGRGTN